MMTACTNASYNELVNIAIASEENYHLHKEAKKKNAQVDHLVALTSVRRLYTNMSIITVLLIIHLSNKPSTSHKLEPLHFFPIHTSRMPLVFALLTHKIIITTHVSIVRSLVTFLRIVPIQGSSIPMLRDYQLISSRTIVRIIIRMLRRIQLFKGLVEFIILRMKLF
jgi:hypothetical protein